MPQTRMRMRPWLELQINSNKIPGLYWLNKKDKTFQIPWKHAAKHGWELEKDACLFKNWAVHTGRYKEGDVEPDPKTWKANFRCAMNSLPDIQEVKDQSISKGPSAVRVYRMLNATVKPEKKEKKSKSPKSKSPRKSVEDIKEEETVEATNSIQLPDDHSGYVLPSYATEDMEVGSTFGISCDLNNGAWRNCPLDIQTPDSTNNMYRLQVSPCYSSSEDEDSPLYEFILNSSEWQQNSIGEKGYLLNEAGMQNLSLDLTLQDQDTAFGLPKLVPRLQNGCNHYKYRLVAQQLNFDCNGRKGETLVTLKEVIPYESKSSAEYTLLDIRTHYVPPISCGI